MSLQGHVAIVTGAGGEGMGRSIGLTLGREGAAVVVNYRTSRERAEATARAIEELGGSAITLAADVADPAAVESMFGAARERFGHVDIVVNSAGAPWKPQDVVDITPEHLRDVLAREVEATYHLLRAALPQMRESGWGRFISIGGHMADDWRFGPPDAPLDYPLGKAARHWITRTFAPRELPHGITINAIAPGPTSRFTFEQAVAAARSGTTAGAENTPQHIAEIAAFLCSDAASRVSGAVIPVPGNRPV
jgi:3-oxoacyl-[acyl-carrier protein] reductase